MRVGAPIVKLFPRLAGLPALLLLAALPGCLDLSPPKACSVTAAPTSLTLPVNGTSVIVGTAFDCKGNTIRNKRVSYSSSNQAVATVTDGGQVIAVAVGSAVVSAVVDGESASVQVTVTPETAASVTVTPNTLTLRETNTRQLSAVARNAQGIIIEGRPSRWSSSNTSIVTVDQNGTIVALSAGQAVITAEVDRTTGSASVLVTRIPIAACRLAPTSSRITVSQGVQPTVTLLDSVGSSLPLTGRALVWTSSNEVVASVSQSGLVVTQRAGSSTITVASADNPSVNCSMTVEAVNPRIDKVIISPKVGSVRIGIPRVLSYGLVDSVGGSIPGGRAVSWRTPDTDILRVTQLGEVTGLKLGIGRVIVSAEGVADTATLTVTKIPLASLVVSPLQATIMEGQTTQLRATLTDSTGVEVTDRPLEWMSSDPTRATVSSTGLVRAMAAGAVSIQAVATEDGRIGQASIIIQQIPVDTIIVAETFKLDSGTVSAFAIRLKDAQGRDMLSRNVLVTSDLPGIAVGVANPQSTQVQVTAYKIGVAQFTLQVIDGNNRPEGKASIVTITVEKPPPPPPVNRQ